MRLHELELLKSPQNILTVVLDTIELDSKWLLASLHESSTTSVIFTNHAEFKTKVSKPVGKTIDLRSRLFSSTGNVFKALDLQKIVPEILSTSPTHVFLEHPDVLLSSGLCSAAQLTSFVETLLQSCSVVVSLSLRKSTMESQLQTAIESQKCLFELLHQCQLRLVVEPLSTGKSNEFSGILSVQNGARTLATHHVQEAEYFFQIAQTHVNLTLKSVLA